MRRVGHIGRMVVLLALCAGCRIVPAPAPFPPIPTIPALERRLLNSASSEEVQWDDGWGASVSQPETTYKIRATWSPVDGVTGYRLYWGTESRNYTHTLDVTGTEATISNLKQGKYFVAVTAYTPISESPFSEEVSAVIPSNSHVVLLYFVQEAPTPHGPWTDIGPAFMVRTNPTDSATFTRIRVERNGR